MKQPKNYRKETDSLGDVFVPSNAYYGSQTQRAKGNFQASGRTLPMEIFHAIAEIKIAAAKANMELGLLDKGKGEAITKAAREVTEGRFYSEFVVDAFQAGAGTSTHMNANEVIANRAIELLKGRKGDYGVVHPNDHVNMGQSTNDVFPTAIRMVSARKMKALESSLASLRRSLLRKSAEFSSILKSGRTHMQDAVPITLGKEFHAYATSIERNMERVKNGRELMMRLNIGKNAIGTGINTHPDFTRHILAHLSQPGTRWVEAQDPIYSTQNASDFLEVSGTLRLLATDLIKLAGDLILLNSGPATGLKEIRLPAVNPGSSIMPGKINPSMAEMLKMVAFQVIGNDLAISSCTQAGQLELNVMTPLIAKDLIESMDILTRGTNLFTRKCIDGITADREACRHYFENSAGIATLLNPYIGYNKAAEVVKESLKTGKTIRQVVLERKLISKADLEKILDYKSVTMPNRKKSSKGRV